MNFNSEKYSKKNIQWILKSDGNMDISLPVFQDGKMKVEVGGLYTEVDSSNGKPKFNILRKGTTSSYNKREKTSCQNINFKFNENKTELAASTDNSIKWTFKSPINSDTHWYISDYICSSDKVFVSAKTSIYHPKRYGGSQVLISIYAIDTSSGNVNWVYDGGNFEDVKQFIVYKENLFINLKNKYLSLDAQTGKVNWINEAEISSMQLYDDVLYTIDSGFLVAISSNNGDKLWSSFLNYTSDSVPVTVYKDNIFVSKGDEVSLLNKMTGTEIWSLDVNSKPLENRVTQPVLIINEMMHVQIDGFLMAVKL